MSNEILNMPLVKIDYVVSFSSEDPEHPASNLLLPDVKSKWLCTAGESSCSVVLQLKSACKIDSITVGAYHVALLEVLVGLSEKPNDPFQVLVPSCVLQAPGAARRGADPESVRSFGAAQLGAARAARWDRVRLVCSQPYNKRCNYGLAFVHICSGDAPPAAAPAAPAAAPAPPDAAAGSDDEFRPGALFASHRARLRHSTDAQIRQASSKALNNIDDSSAHLLTTRGAAGADTGERRRAADRARSGEPRDNTQTARTPRDVRTKRDVADARTGWPKESEKKDPSKSDDDKRDSCFDKDKSTCKDYAKKDDTVDRIDANKISPKNIVEKSDPDAGGAARGRKRKGSETSRGAGGAVLAGVVLALSGYENPRRAALRDAALALGAQYRRDWHPDCTHLVCAFPNTPRLRAARAQRPDTRAVTAEWLEQCARRRRRLPWRWFATEPRLRRPEPPGPPAPGDRDDDEGDTDDEIEKVLQQQNKKQRRDSPRDDAAADARCDRRDGGRDSDVAFVRDERVQAQLTLSTDDDATDEDATDEDERRPQPDSVEITNELPCFWSGCTFVLARALPAAAAARLARCVRAHGGLALRESEVHEDSAAHYVVGSGVGAGAAEGCAGAQRVSPGWVWRAAAGGGASPA